MLGIQTNALSSHGDAGQDKVIINNLRYKVHTTFQRSKFHRFARGTRAHTTKADSPPSPKEQLEAATMMWTTMIN
jgi:hypothetical protein